MDSITYDIYLRALWAVPAILAIIDMDAMLREARERGSDSDVELILALKMVKSENHEPDRVIHRCSG
jgi:hypothetical protein